MSTYATYHVKLKGVQEELQVNADDVKLMCPCADLSSDTVSCAHEQAWFNFIKGDDEQTVAAIPYSQVVYIVD
jgi:hypothetical protein